MDKNKNLYHLENRKNRILHQSGIGYCSNIHEKKDIECLSVGYHPNDKPDMPFASFSIPKNLIHKDNMYGCHTITLSSDLGFN